MNVTLTMTDGTVHTSALAGSATPSATTDDLRKLVMQCMADDLPFYLETEPDCFVVVPAGQIASVYISPTAVAVTPPAYAEPMSMSAEDS